MFAFAVISLSWESHICSGELRSKKLLGKPRYILVVLSLNTRRKKMYNIGPFCIPLSKGRGIFFSKDESYHLTWYGYLPDIGYRESVSCPAHYARRPHTTLSARRKINVTTIQLQCNVIVMRLCVNMIDIICKWWYTMKYKGVLVWHKRI